MESSDESTELWRNPGENASYVGVHSSLAYNWFSNISFPINWLPGLVFVLLDEPREAKVGDLAHVVLPDEDVSRRQVAVDVVLRFEVRHTGRNLGAHVNQLRQLERATFALKISTPLKPPCFHFIFYEIRIRIWIENTCDIQWNSTVEKEMKVHIGPSGTLLNLWNAKTIETVHEGP